MVMIKSIKNNLTKGLFALALVAGVFSCDTDLLDPSPEASLDSKIIFDSPDRVVSQLNGVYDALKSGQLLGGRVFVYGDIRADNFVNETTNGVTGLETWRHTVVSSTNEVNNTWNAAYFAINSANLFLDGLVASSEKYVVPTFPADFATVTVPRYSAEARFCRAVAYLYLVQLYARPYADGNGASPGLPLRLQGESGPANNDLARSTVAEVYTQILADLDFAEQNLPETNASALLNVTRAHRNAAIALKTRVYLNMGQYANVITEANKIVSAGAPFAASSGVLHALQPVIANVFATPYTTTESIFSMPFTENDLPGGQNGLGSYYNPGPAGIGDYSLNLTGIFGNTTIWPATDARRAMTSAVGTRRYLRKFARGPQHLDYAPVIRYAEVLLNLSEAIARTTAGVDARSLALLNAIRNRSDASVTWAPADNAELINAIMAERNVELLGEGFRSNDFVRLLQTIPGKGTVGSVPPAAAVYIWPIPIGELNANKLMTPNN